MLTLVWYLVAYIVLSFLFRGAYLCWVLFQQTYPSNEGVVTYLMPAVLLVSFFITRLVLYGG